MCFLEVGGAIRFGEAPYVFDVPAHVSVGKKVVQGCSKRNFVIYSDLWRRILITQRRDAYLKGEQNCLSALFEDVTL